METWPTGGFNVTSGVAMIDDVLLKLYLPGKDIEKEGETVGNLLYPLKAL